MKLDEIHRVSSIYSGNHKTVKGMLDLKEHIVDDIYVIKKYNVEIYVIMDSDVMVAYLEVIPFSHKIMGKSCLSKEVWIAPTYRNKGYATRLYRYLVKFLDYSIISDDSQTSGGVKLWKRLSNQMHVSVIDVETGKILKRSDIPDNKLYGVDGDFDNKYRLVIKETRIANHVSLIGLNGRGILNEYRKPEVDDGWI